MTQQTVSFTRSSDLDDEALRSMILEADVDGAQVANVKYTDGKWLVSLVSAEGDEQLVDWENFLQIVHRFSSFVVEENEIMLKEAQRVAPGE